MRKALLFSILIFAVAGVLFAQEKNEFNLDSIKISISMRIWNEMESEKKDYIDSIRVLNDTLSSYRLRFAGNSSEKDELTDIIDSLSLRVGELHEKLEKMANESVRLKQDSLNMQKAFITEREKLDAMLQEAEFKSGRADTIVIKMINTYLTLKCTDEKIIELRKDFLNIQNDTLKHDYEDLYKILSLYSETRQKIIALAEEELKKKTITSADPVMDQVYFINIYMDNLENLPYYTEYYNKDWTSPYLNKMLDISFDALKGKDMSRLKEVVVM